jgi:O-antigen ligase
MWRPGCPFNDETMTGTYWMRHLFPSVGVSADNDVFARNNRVSLFLCAIGPAVFGSGISALIWLSILWNLLRLCAGKLRHALTAAELRFCCMMASYPAALFLTSALAPNAFTLDWLRKLAPSLIFLAPALFLKRYAGRDSDSYRRIFVNGALVGAVISAIGAVAVQLFSYSQPEGMAGNSYPFAISAMVAGSMAIMLDARDGRPGLLGFAAFLLSCLTVILSEARAVMICIPVALLLVRWRYGSHLGILLRHRANLAIIALCALALLAFAPALTGRLTLVSTELSRYVHEGDVTTSIGKRLAMWNGSLPIIANAPIFGNGIQNRRAMFAAASQNSGADLYAVNHFHNFVLNALVDGGLVLAIATFVTLLAPLIHSLDAGRQAPDRARTYAAAALVSTYGLSAMTGLAFGHDILDALFVFMASFIVFSSPRSSQIKTTLSNSTHDKFEAGHTK